MHAPIVCASELTRISTVRRVHNTGHNHLANVREYYANIDQAQAQEIIDEVARDYDARHVTRPSSIATGTDVRMMGLNGPRAARGLTQVPITGAPIRLGVGDTGIMIGVPPGATPPPATASENQRQWGARQPNAAPPPDPTRPPPGFPNRPPPGFNPAVPPPGFNPRVPPPGFNPSRPPPGFNSSLPPPGLNLSQPPPPSFGRPPTSFTASSPGYASAQR